jgi:hypothetical protein
LAESVLHLHENFDEVALVLPAPSGLVLGMTVKGPGGGAYRVVRRDDGADPRTGRLVKTWWECLPV